MSSTSEKVTTPMTICFFLNREQQLVLLAKKTRKIGIGKFNGYGGKNNYGESAFNCALRECTIECGLTFTEDNTERVAQIAFQHKEGRIIKESLCDIFVINKWEGIPKASEEMIEPEWFSLSNLPFNDMMPGDSAWIGRALDKQTSYFTGTIVFNDKGEVEDVSLS